MNNQYFLQSDFTPNAVELFCIKQSDGHPDDEFNISFSTEQSSQTLDNNTQSKQNCIKQQNKQEPRKKSRKTLKRQAQERAMLIRAEKLAEMTAEEKVANRINASKLMQALLPQFNRIQEKQYFIKKSILMEQLDLQRIERKTEHTIQKITT